MNSSDLSLRLEPQEVYLNCRHLHSNLSSSFLSHCFAVSVVVHCGGFDRSMSALIELHHVAASSVSHSESTACQTLIRLTGRTVGISLAANINKKPNWNLLPAHVRPCICVCVCVCIKGMVSAWQ